MSTSRAFGADQKFRLALWPILAVIFINTFGMIWYLLSGFAMMLESYGSTALSFDIIFRVALLLVSIIVGYFVYLEQKKRMAAERNAAGAYNMKGKGVIGLIMHILIGLVEAVFAFFTLNTFWIITNFADGEIPFEMQQVYWLGFGFAFIVSAYLITRQAALGVVAFQHKA